MDSMSKRLTLTLQATLLLLAATTGPSHHAEDAQPAHHAEDGFQNLYADPRPTNVFSVLRSRFFSHAQTTRDYT